MFINNQTKVGVYNLDFEMIAYELSKLKLKSKPVQKTNINQHEAIWA